MNQNYMKRFSCAAFIALLSMAFSDAASAVAVAPPLGAAGSYTVLGVNSSPVVGTVTCTDNGPGGPINGDVGSSFTSITNTGCTITGTIDAPVDSSVPSDLALAHSAINSLNPACDGVIPTTSTTLAPGVYCADSAGVTLDSITFTLDGDASDVWVFKVGSGGLGALTGNSFDVVMGGTALPCNVYWRTAQAATMTDSNFQGTIISGSAVTLTRGSITGRALATTDVTVTDVAAVEFAGCAPLSAITVAKNFIPDNVAPVSIDLVCTSGTPTISPLVASEGSPAVFSVGGADISGATCTATESVVPVGHTANQANCVNVPLEGSCTIVNTLASLTTFTVNKDFSPNSPASVSVSATCTGAAVATPSPQLASEGNPAVFTVTGAVGGDTCTATEVVPAGYTEDETSCLAVAMTVGADSSCTIVNTVDPNTITVFKDFLPNDAASVSVSLVCSPDGTPAASPLPASETSPAVFTVNGASPGSTCTATESPVPAGYTAVQTDCVDVALGESCTIVNTAIPNAVTVFKDFFPDSSDAVTVGLTCTDGAVATIASLPAAEGAPAVFTVTGALETTTCTATETVVPEGFLSDESDCVNVALAGNCTITNTFSAILIPTLSEWLLVVLAALLAVAAFVVLRRRATA